MKINKLSLVGGIGGIVLMLTSWVRYFVLFPDLDKALAYGIIGALVISVSFLYDRVRDLDNTLFSVEEWIQDNVARKEE